MHSSEPTEIPIGDITPFAVQEVAAHNYLNAGSSIEVEFSKPIPESLTNDFRDWIELSSAPTNLHARVDNRRLTLLGDFQGGNIITLQAAAGFSGGGAVYIAGRKHLHGVHAACASALIFPGLRARPIGGGNRLFPLLSINVAHVRVRAKLMDTHTAIHALRGYGSYFASEQDRRETTTG